ncbi:MAG: CRISPR-associated helicase Cas3' [Candidatus Sericytochromatia bacterium]|nr:CRISPR-associated helicase Cas3' [Candidatus Sericytochromatia bacterium]
MTSLLYKYWGKAKPKDDNSPTYHLLIYHCLDVTAVAFTFLKMNPQILKKFSQQTKIHENDLLWLICFFVAIHDLGKFSNRFQGQRPELFELLQGDTSVLPYNLRHDSMGFVAWIDFVCEWLTEGEWLTIEFHLPSKKNKWREIWSVWASAVTGHHGEPPVANHDYVYFNQRDVQSLKEFVLLACNLFLSPIQKPLFLNNPKDSLKLFKNFSWSLSGFCTLCDWLGSNQEIFHYKTEEILAESYWEKVALPKAEQALFESGVLIPTIAKNLTLCDLFPKISEPTPLQKLLNEIELPDGPQLFFLEEITGSGKTEAAWLLAYRLMQANLAFGAYLGLPTMATANQAYRRISQAYRKFFVQNDVIPTLILAHSARTLIKEFKNSIGAENSPRDIDYATNEMSASQYCSAWLADKSKASLLATIGIGTLDQALLAILRNKYQALRLFGLYGKVLIVDEVHAYDTYMTETLCALLTSLASQGGSAILLSATMPNKLKQKLAKAFSDGTDYKYTLEEVKSFPLITHVSSEQNPPQAIASRFSEREVQLKFIHKDYQIMDYILSQAKNGACVCWIRNTVADALKAYEQLAQNHPISQIRLFHARFAMGDRQRIEDGVEQIFGVNSTDEKRKGQILIATQVVEQSLDLDFDCLITDLCPIELLIQRAGRLQRHQRDNRPACVKIPPEMLIYSPPFIDNPSSDWFEKIFPGGAKVYPAHGQLWLAMKILRDQEMNKMVVPQRARDMVEAVYGLESDIQIPESLIKHEDASQGKEYADRTISLRSTVEFQAGYTSEELFWKDEPFVPTRLTDVNTTCRLLKWVNGKLNAWIFDDNTYLLSQVNIRDQYFEATSMYSSEQQTALIRLKETMKDKGKWVCCIILELGSDNEWRSWVQDQKGSLRVITYHIHKGLFFERKFSHA